MKVLLLVVALLSNLAFAADQTDAVNEMISFVGTSGPALFQGRDELGNCRLFFYVSGSEKKMEVSFEGTFLQPTGVAAGMVIPFTLHSSSDVTRLEKMSVEKDRLVASVMHISQERDIRILMALEKAPTGQLTTVAYEVPAGVRQCSQLKRLL